MLDDIYVTQRNSPQIEVRRNEVPDSTKSFKKAENQDFSWIFLRNFNGEDQKISGWAGFVSNTGTKPPQKTTIDYYPVIYKPITQ